MVPINVFGMPSVDCGISHSPKRNFSVSSTPNVKTRQKCCCYGAFIRGMAFAKSELRRVIRSGTNSRQRRGRVRAGLRRGSHGKCKGAYHYWSHSGCSELRCMCRLCCHRTRCGIHHWYIHSSHRPFADWTNRQLERSCSWRYFLYGVRCARLWNGRSCLQQLGHCETG